MSLNSLMSYPIWTLLCAVFFPFIAAIATFVCLRRASTARKLTGFFIVIPIYVALTVVFLSDTGAIMSDMLEGCGLSYPPIVGFMSAITLGIFCLNMTALVCGAGLFKPRGAITNAISSIIALAASIFFTYEVWAMRIYFDTELPRYDAGCIYIHDLTSSLPEPIAEFGAEMLSVVLLFVFLIVYFLSFIALKSREEVIKEDIERKRRAALSKPARASKRDIPADDELPECCAYCEYATALKGDRIHMVCDSFGVVSSSHTCRRFLYDPLKRTAARPKIEPLESEDTILDLDHI